MKIKNEKLKLLLRVSFFLLLLVVINNLLLYIHLHVFTKSIYTYHPRHNCAWVKKLPRPPRVLLAGSSAILYSLSPRVLTTYPGYQEGDIIMIAHNARTPIQSYYIYKSLEEQFDRVEIVIYSLDTWIFSRHYYRYDSYLQVDWTLNERYQAARLDYIPAQQVILGGNLSLIVENLLRNAPGKLPGEGSDDSIPDDFGAGKLTEIPRNVNRGDASLFFFDHFGLSNLQFHYLKRLKEELEVRGITFVMLIPPRRSDWTHTYRQNCQAMDSAVIAKLNQFLGPCRIIGGNQQLPIPRALENQFFNDGIHLNPQGQQYYSQLLAPLLPKLKQLPLTPFKNTFLY